MGCKQRERQLGQEAEGVLQESDIFLGVLAVQKAWLVPC